MTNLEFFDHIKKSMKDYFALHGYTKCKVYKGRRNCVCFEKQVEFYTVYVEFCWQTLATEPKTYDFSIGFISTYVLYDEAKPRWWLWSFKERMS